MFKIKYYRGSYLECRVCDAELHNSYRKHRFAGRTDFHKAQICRKYRFVESTDLQEMQIFIQHRLAGCTDFHEAQFSRKYIFAGSTDL